MSTLTYGTGPARALGEALRIGLLVFLATALFAANAGELDRVNLTLGLLAGLVGTACALLYQPWRVRQHRTAA